MSPNRPQYNMAEAMIPVELQTHLETINLCYFSSHPVASAYAAVGLLALDETPLSGDSD